MSRPVPCFLMTITLAAVISAPAYALIPLGATAPDFTKTDLTGTTHSLSDYLGAVVVLDLLGYE